MEPMAIAFVGLIFAMNVVSAVVRSVRMVNNKHRGGADDKRKKRKKRKWGDGLDDDTYDPAFSHLPYNIHHSSRDHLFGN